MNSNKKTYAMLSAVIIFVIVAVICTACSWSNGEKPTGNSSAPDTTALADTAEPSLDSTHITDTADTGTATEPTAQDTATEPTAQDTASNTAADTTPSTESDTTADTTADTAPVGNEAFPNSADDGEWNLILVNPDNFLPEGFDPTLVDIGDGHYADYRIVDSLDRMMSDCRAAGLDPYICSSYRTYDKQVYLYQNKIDQYIASGYTEDMAEAYASMWVAVPGTSEHHTGLAFDIVASDYVVLDSSQASTEVQKWLMANCHNYGFILRYPEDKVNITGINYEPWHYRYVGVEAACYMAEKDICFEEYLEGK